MSWLQNHLIWSEVKQMGKTCWGWKEENRILRFLYRFWMSEIYPTSAFLCPFLLHCPCCVVWRRGTEPKIQQQTARMQKARWSCHWTETRSSNWLWNLFFSYAKWLIIKWFWGWYKSCRTKSYPSCSSVDRTIAVNSSVLIEVLRNW